MLRQEVNLKNVYFVGPSNGTTPVSQFQLNQENTFIAIENIVTFGGEVFLRGAPNRNQLQRKTKAQPAVADSLERSIKEYADIWAELSKY